MRELSLLVHPVMASWPGCPPDGPGWVWPCPGRDCRRGGRRGPEWDAFAPRQPGPATAAREGPTPTPAWHR
jgi:hypothetical protein